MNPFMLISALVTSYLCVVEGPCRLRNWINHGARNYILSRMRFHHEEHERYHQEHVREHQEHVREHQEHVREHHQRYHDYHHDKAYHLESSCPTPSGGQGSCISLYDCNELLSLVNRPDKTQKDIETLRKSQCGFDGSVPKVCCPAKVQRTSCFTADGKEGDCIGLYSCDQVANLLKPPVSKEVIAYVQNSRCKGSDPYSVCCGPVPDFNQNPSPTPNPNPNPNPGPNPGPTTVCNGKVGAFPPDPSSGCCGKQVKLGDRIVGGNATDPDEYPWLVIIEYSKNNKIKLLCGGVLISDRYVLTAGHCVAGAVLDVGTPRNVRLSEFDISNDISQQDCVRTIGGGYDCTDGAVVIPIEQVIAHPGYDPYDTRTRRHDIALLRLSKPAPFTDFIRPICLPSSDLTRSPIDQWQLIAAGWGAVNYTHSKSNIKQHVALPFVPQSECQPAYTVSRRKVDLWKGQMCAGGEEGKDSCKGDSGGPLMWENPNGNKIFEVIGIVSFGPTPCGMEDVPGVYTKVFEYIPWIRQTIKP